MSENKKRYREFCQAHSEVPLFYQAWWLDLVCGKTNWAVALAFDKGRGITGVLPYFVTTEYGLKMLRMPSLTPYLGVWINYPEQQKRNRRYAFEKKVINELLEQVPQTVFRVHHHPIAIENGLPFLWQDYEVHNWYTYRFQSGVNLQLIKNEMKASVRNKIEKASESLKVEITNAPKDFFRINQLTFERQGMKTPYTFDFFKDLDEALSIRGQRKILLAKDLTGQTHAAIYLVWDENTIYNLGLGADTQLRKSGAIQLLLWEGIQLANTKNLNFDFEGSVIESIESVFRDFGAERVPYLRTVKYKNRWWRMLATLMKGK